jgi:hypothetical protein
MLVAIIFIAIGLAILLNTLGIISASFWGFFWSILFIAIGVKILTKKNDCVICNWRTPWNNKTDSHINDCDCEDHYDIKN